MPTCVAILEYDGTDYCGWQRQSGIPSIQEELEKALSTCFKGDHIPVTGSGRTDAGVHARGQTVHFTVPQLTSVSKLCRSLNGLLPPAIAVNMVANAPDGFHARFDARSRRYHYYVSLIPIALERTFRTWLKVTPDFELMNEASRILIGEHHFGAFCRTQSLTTNRICRLSHAAWVPEPPFGYWRFEIQGNRFLHGMVRAIVGTLLQIGTKKRSIENLKRTLASQDRRAAGPAAPAHGLVLEEVTYNYPLFHSAR